MQPQEAAQQLQNLTLVQALQRHDLCFEEIFAIHDLHAQIKQNMKAFITFCQQHPGFTEKLISIGLTCPMHESNNQNMKQITYIASDILTCDHQLIADLFILAPAKKPQSQLSDNEEQIQQEIETEARDSEMNEVDKYRHLHKIFDYIQGESIEQNCINYIAKCLQTLVRKKINQFYAYFQEYPEALARLTQLAHFPSISHLLSKLIGDDEEDFLNTTSQEIRRQVIPFLLQKIHSEIHKQKTGEVLQAIEQILQSTRYGDQKQRSDLQQLSDMIVSESEIDFLLKNLKGALDRTQPSTIFTVNNCIGLLNAILVRMNMDEQKDYAEEPQQFKPKLLYQVDHLFLSFATLVISLRKLDHFQTENAQVYKLVLIKYLQALLNMVKHSRFGLFYEQIRKEDRISAIQILIEKVAKGELRGIILQITSALAEKVILQEQSIASNHQLHQIKISPQQLYQLMHTHQLNIDQIIQKLALENTKERNKNEGGIYIRKLLVVFDNYFQNTEIHKHFPALEHISSLFPSFNRQTCRTYAQKTTVLNHPDGLRAKEPAQFKFMNRSHNCLKDTIVDQYSKLQEKSLEKSIKDEQVLVFKQIKFISQLESRITQIKKRVIDKGKVLDEVAAESSRIVNPTGNAGLVFFVKHLSIY